MVTMMVLMIMRLVRMMVIMTDDESQSILMNMSLIMMLLIKTTTMIGGRKDDHTESNCEKSFTCLRLLAAQGDVPPSFPSLIFLQENLSLMIDTCYC